MLVLEHRDVTGPIVAGSTQPTVIVVLGCRVGPHGALSGAARRRVERAAEAFSRLPRGRVLVSGGKRWGDATEAEAMRDALVAGGVEHEAIDLEQLSQTTFENAMFSAARLEREGVDTIGLVTCDWHMPRARALFERRGLRVVELPAASPPAQARTRLYRGARELFATLLDAAR